MSALDRFGTRLVSTRSVDARARSTSVVVAGRPAAPAGVMQSTSWNSGNGQPMAEAYSAESTINNAYLGEEYVFRCVDKIANSLSSLPFRAGLDLDKPGSFNTHAPLAQLLGPAPGSPNDFWSPAGLWRYVAAQWVLLGKTAFSVQKDPVTGQIIALWPLAVQHLRPIPAGPRAGRPFDGYQFLNPGNPGYRTFRLDEIAYMWRPSLRDPLQPESVIEAAQLNIAVLKMVETYDYQFLKNNATPSTLITTKPFAEPEMRRAFRDQFIATMTGYQNAGKTMFAEAGDEDDPNGGGNVTSAITVARIGLTQKEAQQSETRDAKIRDVCVALGVPLSLLADSSLSKFQNYDTDLRTYWQGTMTDLTIQLRDAINLSVAPLLGREMGFFDVSKVAALQPPKTFKPLDADVAVSMRMMTRDEWRNDMGLPPYSEVDPDDLPIVSPYNSKTPMGTSVEIAELEASGDPVDSGAPTPPVVDPSIPLEIPAVTPIAAARARRAQQALEARVDLVEQGQRALERETRSEQRHSGSEGHSHVPSGHVTSATPAHYVKTAMETMLTTSLQSLFAEQSAAAEARLGGRRGRRAAIDAATSAESLFDQVYWEKRTVDALSSVFAGLADLTPMFEAGGGSAPKGTTMSMGLDAASLGKDVTADTFARLGVAMTNGQIPAMIGQVFTDSQEYAVGLLRDSIQRQFAPSTTTYEAADVQRALLDIHSGRTTTEAAIAALTGAAA